MHWFFDTETTGLLPRPRRIPGQPPPRLPMYDDPAWESCRMIQIAWRLSAGADAGAAGADAAAHYIRPLRADGTTAPIPAEATAIHGIDAATLEHAGADFATVVIPFLETWLPQIETIVAHNIDFDKHVLMSELVRAGRADLARAVREKAMFCTMRYAAANLPGLQKRWPKLAGLYRHLFDREPEGPLHDARTDVRICAECYWKMREIAAAAVPADG